MFFGWVRFGPLGDGKEEGEWANQDGKDTGDQAHNARCLGKVLCLQQPCDEQGQEDGDEDDDAKGKPKHPGESAVFWFLLLWCKLLHMHGYSTIPG